MLLSGPFSPCIPPYLSSIPVLPYLLSCRRFILPLCAAIHRPSHAAVPALLTPCPPFPIVTGASSSLCLPAGLDVSGVEIDRFYLPDARSCRLAIEETSSGGSVNFLAHPHSTHHTASHTFTPGIPAQPFHPAHTPRSVPRHPITPTLSPCTLLQPRLLRRGQLPGNSAHDGRVLQAAGGAADGALQQYKQQYSCRRGQAGVP